MKIAIASDHAGIKLKSEIIEYFCDIEFSDFDINTNKAKDYPDLAQKLCHDFLKGEHIYGILICGSGVGMSIAANRFSNIRAALCFDNIIAQLARQHNDANILCLGARLLSKETTISIIETFINTEFSGGRHQNRVKKIENFK